MFAVQANYIAQPRHISFHQGPIAAAGEPIADVACALASSSAEGFNFKAGPHYVNNSALPSATIDTEIAKFKAANNGSKRMR
jgi:hypothetical protein